MKKEIYIISPLQPGLCINLLDYNGIVTLRDAWLLFGDQCYQNSNLSPTVITMDKSTKVDIGITIVELRKQFKMSRIVVSIQETQPAAAEREFSYTINTYSKYKNTGVIRLSVSAIGTVSNLINYLLQRHQLLTKITLSISANQYLLGVETEGGKVNYISAEGSITLGDKVLLLHASLLYKRSENNLDEFLKLVSDIKDDFIVESSKTSKLIGEYKGIQYLLQDLNDPNCSYQKSNKADAESTDGLIPDHYQEMAEIMTKSPEWSTYFQLLDSKLTEFRHIHILLPPQMGKTQIAFNLRHHYKVIYTSQKNKGLDQLKVLDQMKEIISEEKLPDFLKNLIASFELYGPNFVSSNAIRPLERGLSFSLNEQVPIEIWEFYESILKSMPSSGDSTLKVLRRARTIRKFRDTFVKLLNEYVLFIDDYGWSKPGSCAKDVIEDLRIVRTLKYAALLLGFKVITTATDIVDVDNTPEIKEELGRLFNRSSILIAPFSFSSNHSKFSIEEDQLRNTISKDVLGDEDAKQALCVFLSEQISQSSPGVALVILEFLEEAFKKVDEAKAKSGIIAFRDFRNFIFQEALLKLRLTKNKDFIIDALKALDATGPGGPKRASENLLHCWENDISCRCLDSAQSCSAFIDICVLHDQQGEYEKTCISGCKNSIRKAYEQGSDFEKYRIDSFSFLALLFSVAQNRDEMWEKLKKKFPKSYVSIHFAHSSRKSLNIEQINPSTLESFLESLILDFPRSQYHKIHGSKVNYPNSMYALVENKRIPFLSHLNRPWSGLLDKIFAGALGNFASSDGNQYSFSYYEGDDRADGCLQCCIEEKITLEQLEKIFMQFRKSNSNLNILMCKEDSLPSILVGGCGSRKEIDAEIRVFVNNLKKGIKTSIRMKTSNSFNKQKRILYSKSNRAIELVEDCLRRCNSLKTISSKSSNHYLNCGIRALIKLVSSCRLGGTRALNRFLNNLHITEHDDREDKFSALKLTWAEFNIYQLFFPLEKGCTFYSLSEASNNQKMIIILPLIQR